MDGQVDPEEIHVAYGHRVFPKLLALLQRGEGAPADGASDGVRDFGNGPAGGPQSALGADGGGAAPAAVTAADKVQALKSMLSVLWTQEARARALLDGVVTGLTAALVDEDAGVRDYACRVLAHFATSAGGKSEAAVTGAIGPLGSLLTDEDLDVRRSASRAFKLLAASRDGAAILVDQGAVAPLVHALDDEDVLVVLAALQALVEVTRLDAGLAMALSCEVMPALLRLLQVEELRVPIAQNLANMATHPQGKAESVAEGAVEELCLLVNAPDPELRRLVTGALMGLAVNEDGKVDVAHYGASQLVKALRDSEAAVVRNARAAIQLSSEYPHARTAFKKLLVADRDLFVACFPKDDPTRVNVEDDLDGIDL